MSGEPSYIVTISAVTFYRNACTTVAEGEHCFVHLKQEKIRPQNGNANDSASSIAQEDDASKIPQTASEQLSAHPSASFTPSAPSAVKSAACYSDVNKMERVTLTDYDPKSTLLLLVLPKERQKVKTVFGLSVLTSSVFSAAFFAPALQKHLQKHVHRGSHIFVAMYS